MSGSVDRSDAALNCPLPPGVGATLRNWDTHEPPQMARSRVLFFTALALVPIF